MRRFSPIQSKEDLAILTEELGVLPFFTNEIPGWCVEEHVPESIWFTDQEGPWEWKGHLAYEKACVYGKLVRGKAAFVSLEAFRHLCSFRRDALSFEERLEMQLVPHREKLLYQYVSAHPGELSKYARRECGFSKGYDGVLTHLQMQTYVIDQDFRYSIDRHGRPYGWGNAALILPEDWLGEESVSPGEGIEPEESLNWLVARLHASMPDVPEASFERMLQGR